MFFRSESPARRVAEAAVLGASSVMIVLTGVVGTAAPASAEDDINGGKIETPAGDYLGDVSVENGNVTTSVGGNQTQVGGQQPNNGPTPDPGPGDGVNQTISPPTPGDTRMVTEGISSGSWTRWFDDTSTIGFSTPYGSASHTYDSLYNEFCSGNPSANRSFPYAPGGNAIPLDSVPHNVFTSWSVNAYYEIQQTFWSWTVTDIIRTYDDEGNLLTTETNSTTDGQWREDWRQPRYDYQAGCGVQSSPQRQDRTCTTGLDFRVDGPYDQQKRPIPGVDAGGTNTRTPRLDKFGDETIGHEGVQETTVSQYGLYGLGEANFRSGTPTAQATFDYCVPSREDTFERSDTDNIGSLGRYESPVTKYVNDVDYYKLDQARYSTIYRGLMAGGIIGGIGNGGYFQIVDIGSVYTQNVTNYYKTTCRSGGDDEGKTRTSIVSLSSTSGWNAQNWNDAGEDYYSAECGDAPSDPNQMRQDDLLQCKDFGPIDRVVIDNKPAVPFEQSPMRYVPSRDDGSVDGNNPGLVNLNERQALQQYEAPATADPIYVQWARPEIQTRDGSNINDVGKNQVWEFKYEITDGSSPSLKNTDVNDRNQPYHGWLSTSSTPSGVDALLADNPEKWLTRPWVPNQSNDFATLPPSYEYAPYTFTYEYEYRPYTYRSETYQSGTRSYPCGSYSYQCGTESYVCGSYCTNRTHWGPATNYGWGYVCPGGWSVAGTSCYITVCDVWHNRYCSRPRYCTGTHYCTAPVYSTRQIKNPPPAGFYDNGSQYQKDIPIKDAPPAGWEDNGSSYQRKLPPPDGFSDTGGSGGYVSNVGGTVGMEFDTWNQWYDDSVLSDCTVVMADYDPNLTTQYNIKCGDDFTTGEGSVTGKTRAAIFRFFQSSNAETDGWTVTPYWRVTSDIQTEATTTIGFQPTATGALIPIYGDAGGAWQRMSYTCPGRPFNVVIERVASN